MHYLVDGYNYLHRARLFDATRLEALRLALARRIGALLSATDRATIFWDARGGAPRGAAVREAVGRVEMVYCRGGEGADGAIRAYLRVAAAPRDVCVISDDREVAGTARQHRALVLAVREAERRLGRGTARAARSAGADFPAGEEEGDEKPPPPGREGVGDWLAWFGMPENE
jgi:predicted RNA-binding protein with PIN domain